MTDKTPIHVIKLPGHRVKALARKLIQFRRPRIPSQIKSSSSGPKSEDQPDNLLTVVCISDTHNSKPDLPPGDLLLHAGDLTEWGKFDEIQDQLNWLSSQPHTYKVIVAGNHDTLFDEEFLSRFPDRFPVDEGKTAKDLDFGDVIYLRDSAVTLKFPSAEKGERQLKVYGSPWTPRYTMSAFQYDRDDDIWAGKVQEDTDILLTHGPPRGHLDGIKKSGCQFLATEVLRVKPRLVVFGHIHVGHGRDDVCLDAVGCAYERILSGDGGWITLALMAFGILLQSILCLLPSLRWTDRRLTTYVNAAVLAGMDHQYLYPATVVRM